MFKSEIEIQKPVLVCAHDPWNLGDIIGWFRASGATVNVSDQREQIAQSLAEAAPQWSCLIFEIDGFGGIDDCYDTLRNIREQAPEIPVILISHDFLVDDLTCERLALTDVSLRAPVPLNSLELGLTAARHNNLTWRKRRNGNVYVEE